MGSTASSLLLLRSSQSYHEQCELSSTSQKTPQDLQLPHRLSLSPRLTYPLKMCSLSRVGPTNVVPYPGQEMYFADSKRHDESARVFFSTNGQS